MNRRAFITLLGGAAAWPLAAHAQQGNRMRRIGVLMSLDEIDPVMKTWVSAFTQALADLGWTYGRNVRIDLRATGADTIGYASRRSWWPATRYHPDSRHPATVAVQLETRTIPIVFVNVAEPVAGGLVAALDRPGGNTTGFATLEASLGGKWLELDVYQVGSVGERSTVSGKDRVKRDRPVRVSGRRRYDRRGCAIMNPPAKAHEAHPPSLGRSGLPIGRQPSAGHCALPRLAAKDARSQPLAPLRQRRLIPAGRTSTRSIDTR